MVMHNKKLGNNRDDDNEEISVGRNMSTRMKLFRRLLTILGSIALSTVGVALLNENRRLGTIIIVLGMSAPFWMIFYKNRTKNWWALLPSWLMPVYILLILKIEGTIQELFATLVLIIIALPFSIVYINKGKQWAKRLSAIIHTLSGSLLIVGLLMAYLLAWLLSPFSGVARSIAWGGASVADVDRFPYRVAQRQSPVFNFKDPSPQIVASYKPLFMTVPEEIVKKRIEWENFLEQSGTTSFLVIKDDTLLYEWYGNGYTRESIVTSFSVAKSFVSALIGFAIDDGFIASEEDPITKYIPELIEKDSRFADITIRHLLTMSSGIRYEKGGVPWGDDMLTYYALDMRKSALSVEIEQPPGEVFHYNNYNPLLLGLILERATSKTVTEYMEEKIWRPLGMEADGSWSLDSTGPRKIGFEKMQVGVNGRAIDFAKFGRLYLNQGNWNGRQLLPAEWVEVSTRRDTTTDPTGNYQYMWWVSDELRPADLKEMPNYFAARGALGQFIYVFPAQDVLILRFGLRNDYGDMWSELFVHLVNAMEQIE